METKIRLDCYLWAIRMYKSRSLASEAIKNNKVKLNDSSIKSSHFVKVGEVYTLIFPHAVKKIIEVKALISKRQSYDIAKEHYIDHSPPIEKIEKMDSVFFIPNIKRERGTGRPTKKERRDMTDFREDF
jgi:ribosome-associated heat shock protein Hsp15